MEFGPRALGSRSILADPRAASMRERLNTRVKHRETFRPFAASVQAEHQSRWFKDVFDCHAMEGVFEVRENVRSQIAAVVHVDNSCRIQTVRRETQPFFWELLDAFRKLTGVPMLINTSFNDNEPIVCTVDDAIRCFQRSDLDHLVIGLKVFSKSTARLTA
jgi:carbamoyltransferase